MCEASEDIQIGIAKLMQVTDEAPSVILHNHWSSAPAALKTFISKLAKGNSKVCNNFDKGAIRHLCLKMREHNDPKCAVVLTDLCRFNGVCCERNVGIVVDCLVGHTDSMTVRLKRGKDGRYKIGGDPEWIIACLDLLAAFSEGTSPRKLEFVQTMVDFEMCVAGICLPFPIFGEIQGQGKSVHQPKPSKKKEMKYAVVQETEPKPIELSTEDKGALQELFERYDLNGNGVIDSHEELTQLTTNGAVKFKVRLLPQAVDDLCSQEEISQFYPWSFQHFCSWFTEMILIPNDYTPAIKIDAVEDADKADTAGPDLYTASTRDLLLIKGAYLKLWTQCFVNVNEDVTMRTMMQHQECTPPLASIVPKGYSFCMSCSRTCACAPNVLTAIPNGICRPWRGDQY
jgi:hypothetical protein